LDECDEDDVRAVVEGLSQLVRDLPSFKVILTIRPLPYLDYFLGNLGFHKLFHLQDIESKVVDGDIRRYLKYNLSLENVRERYPRRQWYASDEQIDALVRAAGTLFIIASTAVRYILDKSASNPAAQMQKLLHACAQDHTPFKDLNHFIRKTATSTLATLATLESGQSSQSGPLWKVIEPLICAASKRSESGSFSFRADHQLSEHVLKWYYFHIALGSRFFTSFNYSGLHKCWHFCTSGKH
jgi:hypothetical protein